MHDAVIGLGSNLGSRQALLETAMTLLAATPGVTLEQRSRLYQTPPLSLPGAPPQPDYSNAAVRVRWVGSPEGLLDVLLHVEAQLGRVRRERWGARTLDLDLLWWSGGAVQSQRLRVPHPGLRERAFALAPLLDVAPELSPTLGGSLKALGGPPPTLPWLDPAHMSVEACARQSFPNAAEAVAAFATAWGAVPMEPAPGPLQALAWDPTPRAGSLEQLLRPLRWASAWGFDVHRAVVLDTSERRWRGCLIGVYGQVQAPPRPPPMAVRLVQDPDTGQVKLSLSA